MLDGTAPPPQIYEEENLFYKINHRLLRLYEGFDFAPNTADCDGQGVFVHKVFVRVPQLFKKRLTGQNHVRIREPDPCLAGPVVYRPGFCLCCCFCGVSPPQAGIICSNRVAFTIWRLAIGVFT